MEVQNLVNFRIFSFFGTGGGRKEEIQKFKIQKSNQYYHEHNSYMTGMMKKYMSVALPSLLQC